MKINFPNPSDPKVNLLDLTNIGLSDEFVVKLILELRQSPTLLEYLNLKSIDLAAQLLHELDIHTPAELRENINCTYRGRLQELQELARYAYATIENDKE